MSLSASSCVLATFRAAKTTWKPSLAKRSAVAKPIPGPAPMLRNVFISFFLSTLHLKFVMPRCRSHPPFGRRHHRSCRLDRPVGQAISTCTPGNHLALPFTANVGEDGVHHMRLRQSLGVSPVSFLNA